MLEKQEKRHRRHRRVRAKIYGTAKIPRFCVFRSAIHIYAQLINDEDGKTLMAVSDLKIKKNKSQDKWSKVTKAKEVGGLIAKEALEKKIERVIFDRGGYKYYGRIKALAEGAREGGLKF